MNTVTINPVKSFMSDNQKADVINTVEGLINDGYTNQFLINGNQVHDMFFMYDYVKEFFEENPVNTIVPRLVNTLNAMRSDKLNWFTALQQVESDVIAPCDLKDLANLLVCVHNQYTDILIGQVKAGKIPDA